MRAYQAGDPVSAMCRFLEGVSASGYYAWCKRPPSAEHRKSDLILGDQIEAFFRASRSTYGRPKIHADLRDAGTFVSGKRVARLMRERNIHGVSRRKFTTTTVRNPDARPAADLVDRKFVADQPDAYLMQGRTTFVIAHRLSTIRRADQILVVEAGRIIERGTHESLYDLGGRYYDLYTRQHGLEENLFLAPGEGGEPEPGTAGATSTADVEEPELRNPV